MTLHDMILGAWAIEPGMLREIQGIYAMHLRGEKLDLDAIEARLGRPLAHEQQEYEVLPGGVALLKLSGVMAPKANLFMRVSGGISTRQATLQIESALADARVRSIVVAMDTPGGNVIGVPEFAQAIHDAGAIKPLVVHASEMLLSAGMWAGSGANAIFVSGSVVSVGSIGVVVDREFDPSSRVQQESITAGKYKRLSKPNEPLSDEARAVVQADVDYVYTLFVDDVARYRGVSAEQVLEHMADGRVFRGQQAIDAGLVDGVSTLDALLERMAADPTEFASRRKAVIKKPVAPSASAGAAPKDKTSTRDPKETAMSDSITRASFEQDHAPIFAAIKAEFIVLGATQERDRIKAVLAVGEGLPGHEELLQGLAFDGKTSAADASLAVLGAEKALRAAAIEAHKQDAPPAAKGSAAPADKGEKSRVQQIEEAKTLAKEKGISFVAALKELGYAS
ncbi:S49 family peptidase [Delftia acidovorans]|uniref:S49 family peptidase n=1 Tax=Delftia acidovorans TaxID=80866 RepID=UPI0032DFAEB0